jgi:hypothetical protein
VFHANPTSPIPFVQFTPPLWDGVKHRFIYHNDTTNTTAEAITELRRDGVQ